MIKKSVIFAFQNNTEAIAQLVEHQIVALVVAGSNPVGLPTFFEIYFNDFILS